MSTTADNRGVDLSTAPEDVQAVLNRIMWLEDHAKALREVLLELHSAGLAIAPEIGYVDAAISVRWDEAMGAADDLLKER